MLEAKGRRVKEDQARNVISGRKGEIPANVLSCFELNPHIGRRLSLAPIAAASGSLKKFRVS